MTPRPTCDNVSHPVPQHTDQELQPPLVQQVLPLLGVEAQHPAPPGLVGGILPVRSNASLEDGVGLAGLQETAGLDLEITRVQQPPDLQIGVRQTWLKMVQNSSTVFMLAMETRSWLQESRLLFPENQKVQAWPRLW